MLEQGLVLLNIILKSPELHLSVYELSMLVEA